MPSSPPPLPPAAAVSRSELEGPKSIFSIPTDLGCALFRSQMSHQPEHRQQLWPRVVVIVVVVGVGGGGVEFMIRLVMNINRSRARYERVGLIDL